MANYTIDKFSYGGNNYTLQDNTKTLSAELGSDNDFMTTLGDDATMLILEAGNNISINATTAGANDVTYTISATGGGASYTATSPIDITNSVISHDASGVTAGTYDGGGVKDTGTYFPSFTVDSTGHITSATDLGTLIPIIGTSNDTTSYGSLLSASTWSFALRGLGSTYYTLAAGNTSTTITISTDTYSSSSNKSRFRVADVHAYDMSTGERLFVDWSTPTVVSGGSSLTLTVSIASAWTNAIIIFPILTYAALM